MNYKEAFIKFKKYVARGYRVEDVAQFVGVSTSTGAKWNRFNSHEEYCAYQTGINNRSALRRAAKMAEQIQNGYEDMSESEAQAPGQTKIFEEPKDGASAIEENTRALQELTAAIRALRG